MHRVRSVSLVVSLLVAACSTSPADPGGDQGGSTGFSATIDGVAWQAALAVTAINPVPGFYSITGFRSTGSNAYTMVLALHNIRGPGTYPLGVATNVFGGTAQLSLPPSSGWGTQLNGVSGEIVISALTATRLVATFQFTAEPVLTGTTGTRVVTEGRLDIPVSGTGGVAPDHAGSKVTGTIGGPFNAVTATASIANIGGSPGFGLTANNSTRGIAISIANMTGPGTYALSATTPVRSVGVSGMPGNLLATWTSQATGGSGSVTISSVTTTRITGTFTATLVPLSGGATGNLSVSGSFDMGRPQAP